MKHFKKGDYIVTLKVENYDGDCAKDNYCFKQRIDFNSIEPDVDLSGHSSNGNSLITFDCSKRLKEWRYATEEEILKYEELGKPFDVIILFSNNKPEDMSYLIKIFQELNIV